MDFYEQGSVRSEFGKLQAAYWLAEELLASKELCCMEFGGLDWVWLEGR
jgi:hypothetical protein